MRGSIDILPLNAKLYEHCRALMKRYRDLPMDLADRTLVAIAEHRKIEKTLTLDHRDFNIYRPDHVKHFKIIPALH